MSAVHTDSINDDIARLLQQGGVGILRTDTLYGIVASARSEAAVERVYAIKGRTPTKPPIILIASTDQLLNVYDSTTLARLKTLWPGESERYFTCAWCSSLARAVGGFARVPYARCYRTTRPTQAHRPSYCAECQPRRIVACNEHS